MSNLKSETRALIQYLRDCHSAKKFASYSDMSQLIHADVQTKERGSLVYALKTVQKEHSALFVCHPGNGYKPATSQDVLTIKSSDRKRQVKGIAARWRDEMECINVSALNQSELLRYVQKGFELKFVEAAISDQAEMRIEAEVKKAANPLECYKNIDVMALLGGVG